ncbi:phosphomannose isomerase type I [Capronia coronata CBS 617.96]|uniref:Mannose-6-phosphate isomerase n=1 Tax=Capronia coronata CBS 617.96 TaxID=1182541 RepID=W9YXC6_9EURO|nr:phosphomannose isomerase type I [Capronia coronata CBS 617.96]EXJ93911.1 phosphomannose isomerase type I [Capronia coronata CBS 617.96]
MADSVIQLKCNCNNYPWGRTGRQSLAARLCEKTNPEFKLDDSKSYAEMWMGTYPELPSYSLKTGEDLQEILNRNKDKLIGKTVVDKFGSDLPFLPKILSIAKALPLQIHPNKELSEKLHKEDPEKYTDPNHKPEIAVALGKFEAFIGFKPLPDIEQLMKLESLKQFLPQSGSQKFDNETLREICRAMLKAPENTVAAAVKSLRSTPVEQYGKQAYILDLIPRLEEQYGRSDNGNLIALVCMNYVILEAGSVVYIPADGIHAYLSGDIVECMARSNNVINTGFCPKPDRDSVDLFTNTLTFKQHDPNEPMLKREATAKSGNGKTIEFKPPMSEFNMLVTELAAGETETVKPVLGPSIMIATSGHGKMTVDGQEFPLDEGYIYFVGQGVTLDISASDDLAVYRAYAE